jgi:predicted aconitase
MWGIGKGWTLSNLDTNEIKLTEGEIHVLQGGQGPTMQRVLQTLALYAEALGADRLVDLTGDGHFVISWATPGIAPSFEMLDELTDAGLKTKLPFTLDPCAPLDFENWRLRPEQESALEELYKDQGRYDEKMLQLGLRDKDAYTCNPFEPEVGNVPEKGAILAWSESACAIYANSVLGARTNMNGAIIDLLSYIAGKTPYAGLLTDEGRRADWFVELNTDTLPLPQILGAVIGTKVLGGVPYIVGLDRFLGRGLSDATKDYLREMGAACATYSAVALFHVENITPEASERGRDLLLDDYNNIQIDESNLRQLGSVLSDSVLDPETKPERCFIGCPHLSTRQLNWWSEEILDRLKTQNKDRLAVDTVLCAAPGVIKKFRSDGEMYERMNQVGVRFSSSCAETLYEGEVCTGDAILTNSSKLRAYSTARFFPDEELAGILIDGEIPGGC